MHNNMPTCIYIFKNSLEVLPEPPFQQERKEREVERKKGGEKWEEWGEKSGEWIRYDDAVVDDNENYVNR
jgi:hypothetical protein